MNKLTKILITYLIFPIIALGMTVKVLPVSAAVEDEPGGGGEGSLFEVNDATLDKFDPLLISESEYSDEFSTPGGIITRVLEFAFPLAGIILFLMLIIGGFQIIMGAGEQKSMEAGRQRATYAIIGFLLLFSSYWIVQILGQIFNIKIL